MLEVISLFIAAEITFFVISYFFSLVLVRNFKMDCKSIICSLFFSIIYVATSLYCDVKTKSIAINVLEILFFKWIYGDKTFKIVLATLLNYIVMMISETVFTLIFVYFIGIPVEFFSDNTLGIVIVNLSILLMTILFINIGIVRNLFYRILKWYNAKYFIHFIIIIIIAFGLIAFFTYQNFTGIHSILYFIEVNIALISIFIFVIGYFNQTAKNKLILSDYDQLIEYVKTYEKVVDEKNKNQHEFKNQLILLRSMIKDNDKKTIEYINKLLKIEDNYENYQYLYKLKNLPTGGLKGFIMYKIDVMTEKGIIPFVDISDTLNNEEVWKVCEDNLQDISRAMGVYIDNAIEAASKSKEKYLLIDAEYCDESIVFTISNTYTGKIDFDLIDKEGYTTNGKGRGYGLSLIKDVIDKNSKLSQSREINGIYYVQKLIIKK